MNKLWIWQHPKWPQFEYDISAIQALSYEYAKVAGSSVGKYLQYSKTTQIDVMLDIVVSEALKTSEIEGEKISQEEIRSSIKNQLGISNDKNKVHDKRAEGIAALMLALRDSFAKPLTTDILFSWHELLMLGANPFNNLNYGLWRTNPEPMQIISGPIGKEKIHYEAPPSIKIDKEMEQFIQWFNESENSNISGPIRAAIAHLYFECIHPFDDGNGRVGRAIAEKALAQDLKAPVLLSISTTIAANKKEYYQALSEASKKNLEITPWIIYFINMLLKAQKDSLNIIAFTLKKSLFWKKYGSMLNDRQTSMLKRMFKEGAGGFKGGVSAKKYMNILNVSKATATRDLSSLSENGCIRQLQGAGRSTSYEINLADIKIDGL